MSFKPFDDGTLCALDAAHGEIRVVRGAKPPTKRWAPDFVPEHPWEAVFRKPTMGEGDNFEGAAHNEKTKPGALRNLAKAVVVGVSLDGEQTTCLDAKDPKQVRAVRDAWDKLRTRFSGAHMASQEDLMDLASMAKEEAGKE